ncbi:HIT-like domain-containing protein [Gongronella butleri]|nr:HIT-like domain-containing protein [Gongronella butleri]
MFKFGANLIPDTQIFFQSAHCYGLVNLKPVVTGHVLVVTKRLVPRVKDLSREEACDMILSAQTISSAIEDHYEGTSVTFAIQDGPDAGQTVPHVHVHIIPRKKGDYPNNDDIYDDLNKAGRGVDYEERKPRTQDEMTREADVLRRCFL